MSSMSMKIFYILLKKTNSDIGSQILIIVNSYHFTKLGAG